MLRRTKREVESELPGKTEHVVKCALSAWQQAQYDQIREKVRAGEGGTVPDGRAEAWRGGKGVWIWKNVVKGAVSRLQQAQYD